VGDPDAQLVAVLRPVLRRAGYTVVSATDGPQVLAIWEIERPDLLLLEDQGLPGLAGWQVARAIRQRVGTPVILLSERPSEAAIIRGLESGADVYLAKPVPLRQLLAHMHALLRRTAPDQNPASVLRVQGWVLDTTAQTVTTPAAQSVRLPRLEGALLQLLLANVGRVVPHARLVEACWGYAEERPGPLLKTHMAHLRRKLGLAVRKSAALQAVASIGYRLVLPLG